MERFQNILVTLSFESDEQAELNHALKLTQLYGATITLFSVVPELPSDIHDKISAMSPDEYLAHLITERKNKLETLIKSFFSTEDKAEYQVATGIPSEEITKQVLRENHDLVIIGSRQSKSIKDHIFGSTSNKVLRQCPAPVLAVQPEHSGNYQNILACLDLSPDVKTLNQTIIAEADGIAKIEESQLHTLSIFSGKLPDEDSENTRQQTRDALNALVNTFQLNTDNIKKHVMMGNPAVKIPEAVKRYEADLLVMGMASRTGIMGFIVGNLAEKVLSSVDCSVLTVKPQGFESPIRL